jgi:DNA-binding HxlR family transcriptional regulator
MGMLGLMALGVDYAEQDCSLARALELVGERWTLLILRDCFFGVRRFTDFQTHLNISRAVLTQRLTALVEAGLVDRSPRGGREEYVLTERGIALWPALYALTRWGEAQSARGPRRVFAHVACGTDLDVTGCCPSCGVSPPPGDLQMRPGPGFNAEGRDNPVSAALAHPHRLLEPLLPATGPRWAHRRGGGAYA